jgi:hypothetical protein
VGAGGGAGGREAGDCASGGGSTYDLIVGHLHEKKKFVFVERRLHNGSHIVIRVHLTFRRRQKACHARTPPNLGRASH